ncbi:GNAT family N-acetyltransferase [Vibrio hepatarius]|uniref:GNAT family N-acetyltransferase n=1 Tax=Vibrio hepatarius TaxID=171383 RepID=UPI001C09FB7C|nr:GNAT family N-acetyltransferase [Vibrio hepatarius]MBU2896750.1 GNAT family N-acetyltransferase [Vibrio hepatarius]
MVNYVRGETKAGNFFSKEAVWNVNDSSVFAEVESYFPKQDCWYLPIIGVDPAYMAKGLGSFLMRETLKIIDRSGEGAYLESSNPRNVDFYKNFGFKPLASIRLGGKEVSTPMYRKPIA